MKPQAKPKSNDSIKRILNLPPTLDLMIAFPLAAYGAYILRSGDGSRGVGLITIAIAFCFAGLGLNAVMRNMRELKVLEQYSSRGMVAHLDESKMERLLRAYYATRGYMIEEPSDHQADHEYDFILIKAKERILVRARDWVEDKVHLSVLKKLWGAKRPAKANGLIIVTNGKFADDALDWGRRQNIEMLTGADIEAKVIEAAGLKPAQDSGTSRATHPPANDRPPEAQGDSALKAPALKAAKPDFFLFLDWSLAEKHGTKLREVLEKHPAFKIVATTGKDQQGEIAPAVLSSVGDRLFGKTPDMPQYGAAARYYEIVHYLAGRPDGRNARWVALDSDPRAFPEGCDEVVLASPMNGLDEGVLHALDSRMRLAETKI